MQLRNYQLLACAELKKRLEKGESSILQMPTGLGKTVILLEICMWAFASGQFSKILLLVHGRSLVTQIWRRFRDFGLDAGLWMASRCPNSPIVIASIDTATSQRFHYPDRAREADLVLLDEVHECTSAIRKNLIQKFYDDTPKVGVTATLYHRSKNKRLDHVASEIIYPISMLAAIKRGYLAPMRYIETVAVNTSKLRVVSTGEYDEAEQAEAFGNKKILGSVVEEFSKNLKGRPTLIYCVNIEHSEKTSRAMLEAGYRCVHLDNTYPLQQRDHALQQLIRGEIDAISNVNLITTGVDLPPVSGIVLNRAIRSRNRYLQIVGRGTRICEDKPDCVVLDLGENVRRLGRAEEYGIGKIVPTVSKASGDPEFLEKKCPDCEEPYKGRPRFCKNCGHEINRFEAPENISANSRELSSEEVARMHTEPVPDLPVSYMPPMNISAAYYISDACRVCVRHDLKPGWVFHRVKEAMGLNAAFNLWPRGINQENLMKFYSHPLAVDKVIVPLITQQGVQHAG